MNTGSEVCLDNETENLKPFLENLLEEIDLFARRDADPVELVWKAPEGEREATALLVSALAYGQVAVLKSAATDLLERCEWHPRRFALAATDEELEEAFAGFVYRMTRGLDVADFFAGLRGVLERHQTLEEAYLDLRNKEKGRSAHLRAASRLVQTIRNGRIRTEEARGLRYMLPDPALGSTTKRLHLFFRWMVRGPDEVDLGLWTHVSESDLVMPLDTHTSRICRYLGLTERKSQDLKAAIEVTESLARFDAFDPLRYDFAICHLGISKKCIHKRSDEHCPFCPIEQICQLE